MGFDGCVILFDFSVFFNFFSCACERIVRLVDFILLPNAEKKINSY
jgi:hypothetical protein